MFFFPPLSVVPVVILSAVERIWPCNGRQRAAGTNTALAPLWLKGGRFDIGKPRGGIAHTNRCFSIPPFVSRRHQGKSMAARSPQTRDICVCSSRIAQTAGNRCLKNCNTRPCLRGGQDFGNVSSVLIQGRACITYYPCQRRLCQSPHPWSAP